MKVHWIESPLRAYKLSGWLLGRNLPACGQKKSIYATPKSDLRIVTCKRCQKILTSRRQQSAHV